MEQLIQQVASGLANGAIYACLALALVMIFVSTDHINFAQGELAMFSAYLVWQALAWGLNFWVALPAVALFSFLIGVGIERVIAMPISSVRNQTFELLSKKSRLFGNNCREGGLVRS